MSIAIDSSSSSSADLGSWNDFLYGLCIGYLLGFLVLFCIWDRNIPHRQKIGLLAGVILSSVMNMTTKYITDAFQSNDSGSNGTLDNSSGSDIYSGDTSVHQLPASGGKGVGMHHLRGSFSF
jgi:hypothetical protein